MAGRDAGRARRPPQQRERSTRTRQTGATRPALDIRVRILDGASAGTEYAISGSLVRIGRGEDNDIVLPDSNCSRYHAELVKDGSGRYLVRDVGSRNGISVNRRKVPQTVLSSGDIVTVGSTNVEFVSDGGGKSQATGTAKRWIVVAVAAGGLGFALVSFGGSGGRTERRDSTGPVVVGTPSSSLLIPGSSNTTTPVPGAPDGVSIASLFASQPAAQPNPTKGSDVGRNTLTKPVPGSTPAVQLGSLPNGAAGEKMIAAIMSEGERAYLSGKLVEARASFERAMRLDKNCERCATRYDAVEKQIVKEIDGAMASGYTYMETQRWDQATNAFERVKFLDPDPSSINNATATSNIKDIAERKARGGR